MNGPLFCSQSDEWVTPDSVFTPLDFEFGEFDVDLAATRENAKVSRFFSIEDSALDHDWAAEFPRGTGWCNPPNSRGLQKKFVEKASHEACLGFTTVMLLPARTDTRLFHDHIWDQRLHRPRGGVEVRFLKGRLRFSNAAAGAPFPSMVVVFHGI
jgi:phage N-6-adenine-methyltransferase